MVSAFVNWSTWDIVAGWAWEFTKLQLHGKRLALSTG